MHFEPPIAARAAFACAALAMLCASTGCKHLPEKRAVGGFAEALEQADPQALDRVTSREFRSQALADQSGIADVQRMWPVKGKLEVVAVKEIATEDRRDEQIPEKLVTVKDERGWKTDHRLIRESKSGRWVVDEVFVSQKQKGITATKTVTEQVVFLAAVREFAVAWQSGSTEAKLKDLTDPCRAELKPLPESVLNHLAGRMFPADMKTDMPEATMDEDIAVARVRRPTGAVLIQMKRVDGQWLVDDAALDDGGDGDNIPSLRKTAIAYAASAKFLDAYQAGNLASLEGTATDRFFVETLKPADLKMVPLPSPAVAESGTLKVVGRQAELVIPDGDRTVRLNLVRVDNEDDVNSHTEFRVEDVTLFENEGKVKTRLASLLVAEPLMHLYADALITRDLGQMRALSTNDFNTKVWSQVRPEFRDSLPLGELQPGPREILSTVHDGSVSEITVMQSGRAMTFILKEEVGAVRVDDVLVAVSDRPSSLKTTIAQVLPVLRFSNAIATADIDALRDESSSDFNRLIWSQVRELPPAAASAGRFLNAPLTSLKVNPGETQVRLGSAEFGSSVQLIEVNGRLKVHDLQIIAGPAASDQAALKTLLRDQMANGTLFAGQSPSKPASPAGSIMQVSFEEVEHDVEPPESKSSEIEALSPQPVPIGNGTSPTTGSTERSSAPPAPTTSANTAASSLGPIGDAAPFDLPLR